MLSSDEVTGVSVGVVFRLAPDPDRSPVATFAELDTVTAADFAEAAMDHDASRRLSAIYQHAKAAGRVATFAEFFNRYAGA